MRKFNKAKTKAPKPVANNAERGVIADKDSGISSKTDIKIIIPAANPIPITIAFWFFLKIKANATPMIVVIPDRSERKITAKFSDIP